MPSLAGRLESGLRVQWVRRMLVLRPSPGDASSTDPSSNPPSRGLPYWQLRNLTQSPRLSSHIPSCQQYSSGPCGHQEPPGSFRPRLAWASVTPALVPSSLPYLLEVRGTGGGGKGGFYPSVDLEPESSTPSSLKRHLVEEHSRVGSETVLPGDTARSKNNSEFRRNIGAGRQSASTLVYRWGN